MASVRLLQHHQHASGEILAYRRDAAGNYCYRRSVLVSALVHDGLRCFDPTGPAALEGALGMIDGGPGRWFAQAVTDLRRRIRDFLLWQQDAAGWWRFLGRGSGIDPDVATTAAAALALSEGYGARTVARWERQPAVVRSFRSASGMFFTFQRGGAGYGWMDADGRPVVGFDPVVNAQVLEFLCAIGWSDRPEARQLAAHLARVALAPALDGSPPSERQVAPTQEPGAPPLIRQSKLYPHPLSFPAALARVQHRFDPGFPASVRTGILSAVLTLQTRAGDFGGPLRTAIGATALLDLDGPEDAITRAGQAVLRGLRPQGGWTSEDYLVQGVGSPAWTTAASLAFLGRYHHRTGRLAP